MKSDFIDVEHFYAARIKSFEQEREEITNYIHLIGPQQNELHILHWQGIQSLSTTTNVRDRYSKEHSKLEETLWQSQESKSELHAISHNDTASDLMIQQLSELSRPLQHDITYLFEDKFTSLNSNDRKSRLSLRNPDSSKVTSKKPNSGVLKQVNALRIRLI